MELKLEGRGRHGAYDEVLLKAIIEEYVAASKKDQSARRTPQVKIIQQPTSAP
jgi:hypothetical protein